MRLPKMKYLVGFVDKIDSILLVSMNSSKIGMDEGWYLFIHDDYGHQAIEAGPFQTALEALNSQANKPSRPLSSHPPTIA